MKPGPQVPAAPVRIHVQNLIDAGMRQAAICRAARVSSAYLSALLYGNYDPARTPMQSTGAEVAARLMAVEYEAPAPRISTALCEGRRFEAVGYRVGRCDDCGQIAPVQTRSGVNHMYAHPRPDSAAQEPGTLPAATAVHSDCGSTKGVGRHKRERTDLCGPCRWVQRGYDAGYKAAMTRAAREAHNAVPAEVARDVVAFCRAFALQPWPPGRPLSRSRALARQVVRTADAELADDGQAAA